MTISSNLRVLAINPSKEYELKITTLQIIH